MGPSIKSLRRVVMTGGVALLLVVAGFLALARFKGHHFHLDLPGRLGADISQTANGFTYSQSQKGHTLFTIHASKLVQYKGDQAELHDVTITLYGPEGSGRSDKIYGSAFTYDRKQGIAKATGAVRIDFASPENPAKKPGSGQPAAPEQADSNTIHVTTSGLVFKQATGEASTDQRVDFALTRAAGSAIGADYNAKDGVLILNAQVALTTGSLGGSTGETTIHAEHAQLLRDTHQAYLIKPDATMGGRRTDSDQATVTFRPDGSAEHVEARGHVRLSTEDGGEMHASNAQIELDGESRPLLAVLAGGVTYAADDRAQTMQGTAVAATLTFVPAPVAGAAPVSAAGSAANAARPGARQELHHAQFRNAVTFVLQQHSLAGDPNGSATREMRASTVDIDFAPGAVGKAEAQHVLGTGGAMANLHDVPAKGPSKSTSISADQLLATLAGGRAFKVLDGKGSTKVVDSTGNGATSTTTGNLLHVTFADARTGAGSAQVETAEQSGSVVLLQVPSAEAKNADGSPQAPLHADAQQAEYRAADQVLYLTGDPHLHNDSLALSADRVDYHRDSGDAAAMGNVKSTYTPQAGRKAPTLGGEGPVHVTADHAQLNGSTDTSVFFGTAAAPARMWQGADAVAAPVLELARDEQTLDAHGERGDRAAVVHATLGSRAATDRPPVNAAAPSKAEPALKSVAPTRLTSMTLRYSDQDHRADLRGAVTAEQPSGTLHADQAQVFLTPEAPNKPSQLDHLVAIGHVVLTQPGRRGSGERLVYTAADGRYVLTGTPAQPPRIVDAQKGTTTGAALIFRGADDSVEVSSRADQVAGSAAGPARTVTDTHAPK